MNLRTLLVFPVALGFLCGCMANLPQSLDNTPLVALSSIDSPYLFAANPSGSKVAVSLGGLKLIDRATGKSQVLSRLKPVALAWSPDGPRLAAAFVEPTQETRLYLYAADGKQLDEFRLASVLNGLTFSARGDLVATGYRLELHSFGGSLAQKLYRLVDGKVEEFPLTDTTLKPATAKLLAPLMAEVLPVYFSPYGDELVYVQLHDPPQFPPYIDILYRNWQGSAARKLLKLPLQSVQLRQGTHAESVEVLTAQGIQSLDLWAHSQQGAMASPGYRFAAGQLILDGEVAADWGQEARFQGLPGGHFLAAVRGKLYAGAGLPTDHSAGYSAKVWRLRLWRFEGLITENEFTKLLAEEK